MSELIGDRLDAERILADLTPEVQTRLRKLTLLQKVESTNSALARMPAPELHAHALLAECQTSGRGRRQRTWYSPAGGNIYLSLGWRFEDSDLPLATLPLVTAICICNALAGCGLSGHGIKWPNDILVDDEKLAGILVEMQSAGNGPAAAVIGAGINVSMPARAGDDIGSVIDRPWTDLASQLPADTPMPSRNRLVALVLGELLPALELFEDAGFEAFREAWRQLDLLKGRRTRLEQNGQYMVGTARGVDENGGLLLEIENLGIRTFHSGEVSVEHG